MKIMSKIGLLLIAFLFTSCGQRQNVENSSTAMKEEQSVTNNTPDFNADSAYQYVANQVSFGPRVPNTKAHKDCALYLESELKRFGANVFIQEALLEAYNGEMLESKNIIGTYNPEATKRVLLFAHWDSRPFADSDPDKANHYTPIDGADDGASGVGVLLEIARQLQQKSPAIGIDLIFFDAEDYGTHTGEVERKDHTWCLGSQFWAKNPHVPNYKAEYGILLDMVGHKDAQFYKELTSLKYAAPVVEKIWQTAKDLGYGRFFINARGGGVVDDHEYVIAGRNIPCVDIINYDPNRNGFGDYWHTMDDTIDNISTATLKAVGQTVLEIIYN